MRNILYDGYLGPRLPKEVQMERIRTVIREELTEKQREIFLAYYFQQRTVPQIAEDLGRNKSTVLRNLRRAEARVRRCLRY